MWAWRANQHLLFTECGGDIYLNKTTFSLSSPDYPSSSPHGSECSWRVSNPRGMAVVVQAINLDFGSEIKDDCENGRLEIFNGCGSERFLVEKICQRPKTEPVGILWVSSGSCVTIKFSSGKRKDNKFRLSVAESAGKMTSVYYFLRTVKSILLFVICETKWNRDELKIWNLLNENLSHIQSIFI